MNNVLPNLKYTHPFNSRRKLDNGAEFLLLAKWERYVRQMQFDCQTLGPTRCLTVRYEQLVLYPERTLHNVMGKFVLHVVAYMVKTPPTRSVIMSWSSCCWKAKRQ